MGINFSGYAKWSYEQLILRQPRVRIEGLWKKGTRFFIVCPDIQSNPLTKEGLPLTQWFDSIRTIGIPILLVASPPEGGEILPTRTLEDMAELLDAQLTIREVSIQMALSIPRNFPNFILETTPPNAYIYIPRDLQLEEEKEFRKAFEPFRVGMSLSILTAPDRFNEPIEFRNKHIPGDIVLIPSNRLSASYSKSIRFALEEDEEFWVDNRTAVLTSNIQEPGRLLPKNFQRADACCLVDASVFPTKNLRTYISLYSRTILVMPLADNYSNMLSTLRVKEEELVELARRGRLQFLVPQSLDRYPSTLLEQLVDIENNPLLFSRRLATAVIADTRRRIPMLYPPLSIKERKLFLETLTSIQDQDLKKFAFSISDALGEIWASEHSVHFLGAMATLTNGIGRFLAALFSEKNESILFPELMITAGTVGWAGTLRATVFPIQTNGYDGQVLTEFCASAYSGIRNEKVPTSLGAMETVIDGLLGINNDAPILEVSDVFSAGDTDRIRNLVYKCGHSDISMLNAEIEKMNAKVKEYEKNVKRLNQLDLMGLAGVFAGIVHSESYIGFVPFGIWIANRLLQFDADGDPYRKIIDQARAINSFTSADVVLVSRMRQNLHQ